MRLVALIGFVLMWFLNSVILQLVYDVTVYEEYIKFWNTRGILYDSMFFFISLILFTTWRGIEKSIACFMVVITLGSVIDKAVFKVSDYMYGDIVLVILAIITSYIIYGRDRKRA